jgi:hypothetical protein
MTWNDKELRLFVQREKLVGGYFCTAANISVETEGLFGCTESVIREALDEF